MKIDKSLILDEDFEDELYDHLEQCDGKNTRTDKVHKKMNMTKKFKKSHRSHSKLSNEFDD